MKIQQYVVDAFTDRVFFGNPAAVCLLEAPLSDHLMQQIARENNLSETAFAVRQGSGWSLRWFTPGGEIDLCGHATLACAFILFEVQGGEGGQIAFSTMSGQLIVRKKDKRYEMDFPAYPLRPVTVTADMIRALGAAPVETYLGRDLLCVFEKEELVRQLAPDSDRLCTLDGLLVHVTAPGDEAIYDCVSRSFAPKLNVKEDPVCGSGHCHIAPYWCDRLSRRTLTAYQASARGGTLYCRVEGDRVMLAGQAALYAKSELFLPDDAT